MNTNIIASGEVRKPKRTWHYLMQPRHFEMAPCDCGNHDTMWSEYAKHLWCPKCEIDFVAKHSGIFDGPIPIKTCALMGLSFDRLNMATGFVERLNLDTIKYEPEEIPVMDPIVFDEADLPKSESI